MKSDNDATQTRDDAGRKEYRQYVRQFQTNENSLVVKSPWIMLELCMSATRVPTSLATFMASSSTRVIFVLLLLFGLLVRPVLPEGMSLGRLLGPSCAPIQSLASCFSSSESRSGAKSASSSAEGMEPLQALFSRNSRTVHPSMCSRYMQDEVAAVVAFRWLLLMFEFSRSPSLPVLVLASLLSPADTIALEPDVRLRAREGTANSTPITAGQRTPALRQRVRHRASAFVRLLVRRTSRVGWRYDLAKRSLQMAARDVDDNDEDDVPPLLLVPLTIVR